MSALKLYADSEFRFDPDESTYIILVDERGNVESAQVWDENLDAYIDCTAALKCNKDRCNEIHAYVDELSQDDGDCEMTLAHRAAEYELEERE